MDANLSWNCGIEGPSDDPAIERLRNRMVKNFLALTLLSVGTPMLLMGDEVRRTQRGNNNAYCQDNEISWFDWSLLEKHRDIHRFVKILTENRRRETERTLPNVTLNQLLGAGSSGVAVGPNCVPTPTGAISLQAGHHRVFSFR